MAKKKIIKHEVIAIPKSLEEATDCLGRIGQARREIDGLTKKTNDRVEEVKAEGVSQVKPYQEEIEKLTDGLYIFTENNRQKLEEEGKRSFRVPTGTFGLRTTPPAAYISSTKTALASCKQLGLDQFIRIKTVEEINKEAVLREPELASSVNGLSITQREEFVVKPSEIEVEIVSNAKKLKKRIG